MTGHCRLVASCILYDTLNGLKQVAEPATPWVHRRLGARKLGEFRGGDDDEHDNVADDDDDRAGSAGGVAADVEHDGKMRMMLLKVLKVFAIKVRC